MFYETLLIGIIIAALYVEITGIYPGGIIVPAYLALYFDRPQCIAATLLVAFLSLLTYRLTARFLILFGRRRFVFFILIGVIWAQVFALLFPQFFPERMDVRVIGWIIPGLLANNLERQKLLPTAASLLTVATLTYFVVRLVGMAL